MCKFFKVLLVFAVILGIAVNFTYAVDLNLTEQVNGTISSNVINNNNLADTNVTDDVDSEFEDTLPSNTISSTTVSTVTSLPEANLGLSNILNILLITVGVVLIFLGIAILIKIK